MTHANHLGLLKLIDQFLEETGMGESYFGKKAVGNSEVVKRLREGGRVWPETEAQLLKFIRDNYDLGEAAA